MACENAIGGDPNSHRIPTETDAARLCDAFAAGGRAGTIWEEGLLARPNANERCTPKTERRAYAIEVAPQMTQLRAATFA